MFNELLSKNQQIEQNAAKLQANREATVEQASLETQQLRAEIIQRSQIMGQMAQSQKEARREQLIDSAGEGIREGVKLVAANLAVIASFSKEQEYASSASASSIRFSSSAKRLADSSVPEEKQTYDKDDVILKEIAQEIQKLELEKQNCVLKDDSKQAYDLWYDEQRKILMEHGEPSSLKLSMSKTFSYEQWRKSKQQENQVILNIKDELTRKIASANGRYIKEVSNAKAVANNYDLAYDRIAEHFKSKLGIAKNAEHLFHEEITDFMNTTFPTRAKFYEKTAIRDLNNLSHPASQTLISLLNGNEVTDKSMWQQDKFNSSPLPQKALSVQLPLIKEHFAKLAEMYSPELKRGLKLGATTAKGAGAFLKSGKALVTIGTEAVGLKLASNDEKIEKKISVIEAKINLCHDTLARIAGNDTDKLEELSKEFATFLTEASGQIELKAVKQMVDKANLTMKVSVLSAKFDTFGMPPL